MVNDTCEDSFERIADEPALVCLPPPEDDDSDKEKQEVKNLAKPTAKRDEHLSTFRVEKIVPIPRESEDSSGSDSENVLPSCDDFSSINVPRDDFVTFSNPLFQFNDEYVSSDVNPLFDEDECLAPGDDIEFLLYHDPSTPMKSVASIIEGFIDEPPLEENYDLFDLECKMNDWKKILYDAPNDDMIFDPGGDNDEIDAFLAIEVSTCIEEGYYDSEGDIFYLESLLSDDTIHNLSSEVFFDHEPQHFKNESDHDTLRTFSPNSDPLHHKFTGELITIPPRIDREHEDYINRMCDSNREEIDIFSSQDDSIPPGIESDFDSEEEIIFDNLLNNDPISEYERLTFDVKPDAPVINNFDELNEDQCFDPGEVRLMLKLTIPLHLSFRLFSRISPTLRILLYFSPPGVKTPFFTLASSLRASGISSGGNFHVL
ncbi:hypothetical protein Tco_1124881 [Tanacetum coccineum]|uniref:Reverse transcriptase domain-containing protein n=1 Tax=Tanacetum coccineum TaxID=301880 RepID=A0ABQ5J8J0_9ASTR